MNGYKLKNLRLKNGLSQEELADKLSVSRDLVSKWETDKRRPSYEMIKNMSVIFNVTPDDIAPPDKMILDELSLCIPTDTVLSSAKAEKEINFFLSELSSRERSIFISRYYYLKSISDICQEHRISKNYTRVILHRSRIKLKKHFEEAGKNDK